MDKTRREFLKLFGTGVAATTANPVAVAKAATEPFSLLLTDPDPEAKASASPILRVIMNNQLKILHEVPPKESALDEIIEVVPRMNGGFETFINISAEDIARRLLDLKEEFANQKLPPRKKDVLEGEPKELHEPKTT